MELTLPTEPQERAWTDRRLIEWRLLIRPMLPEEINQSLEAHGLPDILHVTRNPTSPQVSRWALSVASKHLVEILSAHVRSEDMDEPVRVNGLEVSDKSLRQPLLERHTGLAMAVADHATALGHTVESERGN